MYHLCLSRKWLKSERECSIKDTSVKVVSCCISFSYAKENKAFKLYEKR